MKDINEGIFGKKDPVTGKRYYGKKVGDDQADPNAEPSKGFSVGGVDPETNKPFLGVQPGRDPSNTLTGKLSRAFIPRLDKETGRLYMGDRVGDDQAGQKAMAVASAGAAAGAAAGAKAVPTSSSAGDVATPSSASAKPSSFGAAFKAARQARLSGKGGDTFEFNGKKYHSYQAGEKRTGAATPAASSAARPAATAAPAAAARQASAAMSAAIPKAEAGAQKLDALIAGGIDKNTPSGVANADTKDPAQRYYRDPSKVFTQVTRDPGENSITTTRKGNTTSVVSVSGGGSTEQRAIDNRTPAEKASDEAKDKAENEARLAAARKRQTERQGNKGSVPGSTNIGSAVSESVDNYKESFRSTISEATKIKPKSEPGIIAKYGPKILRATPGLSAGIAVGGLAALGTKAALSSFDATNVEKAKEQNKDLKTAALDKGAPLLAGWGAGNITQSLVDRAVNKVSGVKSPPITLRGIGLGGARAAAPAAAETLASYLETKAEKNPSIEQPVKRATPIIRGLGYGYGFAGAPGAAVGGLIGAVKSGTEGVSYEYKNKLTDQERSNMRSRGIARFGFNPYERLDAEVAAEKKKREATARTPSALDRTRAKQQMDQRLQQKPGVGVLKRPGA